MVLRKPYAFFIRIFKPLHLVVSFLIAYLIYLDSRILSFLNTYIYSVSNTVGEAIKERLASSFLISIPAVIIFISLIVLGVMTRKKKPTLFYFVSVFAYVAVIIINLYTFNFLGVLEKNIVAIRLVKLIHDLVFINIIIEVVTLIFFLIRGIGLNFKKFDFNSEISKFDISESDKEEFEVSVNVDLDERKRKRKRDLRLIKYKYLENKFVFNLGILIGSFIVITTIIVVIVSRTKLNKEGYQYTVNGFNVTVEDTYILNTDYKGDKLTDNYLIVVNCKMNAVFANKKVFLDDFGLKIGEVNFKPITKYSNNLVDIGNIYDKSMLPYEVDNYIFIFEIPEKFTTSDMIFNYIGEGERLEVKLNPKSIVSNDIAVTKNIGDEISFNESIGNISFKINSYDINKSFSLSYDYCIKKDDCVSSKEYILPSVDTDFDKVVLNLTVDYVDNSTLEIENFYKFFSKFGSIYYKKGDVWYSQRSNFEEIKSKKTNTGNNVYIGVRSEILNSDSIKLVFNIRNSKYEYILK